MTTIGLVTEANRGIGFEICRQLGQRGLQVLLTARNAERGRLAAQALTDEGLDVQFHPLDVTDPDSVSALGAVVEQDFGTLDVLINNAAIYPDSGVSVFDISLALLRDTFAVNALIYRS